ncbi:Hpt domain-containing protein [Pseudomonas sp. OIL-1]|uniref:Hpt domain-containing protein n=1 Tax=Pseudomonas sp. OIL-1 TaxID=2706126 RepID=UPI0013A72069|nr:Hpt domain-containing protein [Pseudomonas sp. OIL-1]QIB50604.1 response regulator [Pseudomonas sp. OIL-1]
MGDRHDYVALDWVKGEISETLGQARQALEAFVENPEDSTRLRFCLTYIHQVHGTLQMVEFYGAALLAEEMEQLAQSLMHGTASREGEALEVLMQSILQMPAYLDRVQSGRRDLPLVLLPLLNDMRSARGEKLLSENALFSPDLGEQGDIDLSPAPEFADDLIVMRLRKLRQAMQIAQAGIIREQNVAANSHQLGRVFARLESLFKGVPFGDLWTIFAGVAEGLELGTIETGTAIRNLLREGDRELRRLVEKGIAARGETPPPELQRNLLFYVAKSLGSSPRLDALKDRYQLRTLWTQAERDAQSSGSRLVGPDRSAMQSVVVALGEELLQVKERLDLFVRSDRSDLGNLKALLPTLKQIADTLAMLGLGQPRRVLQDQIVRLEQLANGDIEVDDAGLMDIAGGLLFVEASLQGVSGQERGEAAEADGESETSQAPVSQDMAQVHQQVVQEARNALEHTRDAINSFIAQQWNHDQLQPVDEYLNSVRGGMEMLGLQRAADTLGACRLYVIEQLITTQSIPDWESLDALADVITSIDYYLERLAEDDSDRGDSILSVAEERLAVLDYDPAGVSRRKAEADNQPTSVIPGEATAVQTPAEEMEDVEELDTELVEIFIEEAGEVLEALAEFTPIWQAEPENHKARAEVRRSFHTLKGSGRMVRAGVLAELSWSVENMLNRVIDRSIELTPTVFSVINAVRELMPRLVEDFAANTQQQLPEVSRLSAHADALSKGLTLPEDAPAPVQLAGEAASLGEAEPEEVVDTEALAAGCVSDQSPALDEEPVVVPESELTESSSEQAMVEASEPREGDEPEEDWINAQLDAELLSAEPAGLEPDDETTQLLPAAPGDVDEEQAQALETGDQSDALQTDADATAAMPETEQAEAELHLDDAEALVAVDAGVAEASEGMDPVLLEIFNNETQVHIEEIRRFIARCEDSVPQPISDALQRALHTLKGSAHMAGIQPIARLVTPLEKLAKDFKGNLIDADASLAALLAEVVGMIETGLVQLQSDPEQAIAGSDSFLGRVKALHDEGLSQLESRRSDAEDSRDNQAGLLSIFLTEGIELLLDAADALQAWRRGEGDIDGYGLVRSLRELGEVAGDVELNTLETLCLRLEEVHEAILDGRLQLDDSVALALEAAHDRLIVMMDQVASHQFVVPAENEMAALHALFVDERTPDAIVSLAEEEPTGSAEAQEQTVSQGSQDDTPPGMWHPREAVTDHELVDIFLEEAQEIIESSGESLRTWLDDTGNNIAVEALQRDLHTLKGGARMAEIRPVGDLAHELEFLYEGICEFRYQPSEHLAALLHACHDSLADMVEGVTAGRPISDGLGLIGAIRAYRAHPDQPVELPSRDSAAQSEFNVKATSSPAAAQPSAFSQPMQGMLAMFLEEARELLEPCAALLQRREDDPTAAHDLLHRVQTLKGSARLANQHDLAEQAKLLETALHESEPDHVELLERSLSELQSAIEMLASGQELSAIDWSLTAHTQPGSVTTSSKSAEKPRVIDSGKTLADVKAILQQAMEAGDERRSNARNSAQETVKVPAGLLEDLVNLAGETSIFRGRIEQQVTDLSHTLQDVESTIERVRDQLRRLDMETQAQILSRHQEEIEQAYEEFDPLEMDRYSQLQQLSRSLFESASDLLDLKETLASKSRDAETLLIQQARVNTELQEGLMRTRMVPFDRLLPRMRRVVRQVAGELGKQVELVVGNAEGEMDRSVLERMIGPLEHMLRNAVDHGIEMPAGREAAGKPEEGRITLDLRREGSEIVLQLADDGKGINLDAVRRKAIERGLLDSDVELSDDEILQLILEAGFSTADKITQISGRGVGMDVVNAEVKQLGGSMTLVNEPGQGTAFTIRLPFTVSVNRALMVYSGDDLFAIPLNTIEGIVRVSGYELEAYYAPDAPPFEYAGKTYDLRYLGELLVTGQQPRLTGHSLPLPVILVRGAEHSMAVQVDALAGSREIVVKSLGKQFAVVPGISGATILGDGRVVVILDLLAVIRAQQALQSQQRLAAERAQSIAAPLEERSTLVMVVDDSITVRKVTTRLLERHGMEVVTAKDGVEAIAMLQDIQPDIMLLDIEMPRMDGFEVATLVRHDERLQNLPIIMITSRTGEKHRERARTIGVNDYLGKPYQETELLEAIGKLVTIRE